MSSVSPTTPQGPGTVLSTLNTDGSRRWLRPRLSEGRFLLRRRVVAYVLIAVFTLIPYITINGKPAVLLDLPARRFHILGATFLPTDTLLIALGGVTIFVLIFLLTALFGRVWCGWACPQTVYMEFVYRPIERFFTGSPGRAKATKGVKGWLQSTGAGKPLMYVAYFLISCYLAHTFLAYFVGVEALRQWMTQSPLEHPAPFLVMACVTGLMMFDFAFFREQTCLVACPYGRFQSALLDRHSMIVSYDVARGEPRGVRKQKSGDVSLPVAQPSLAMGFAGIAPALAGVGAPAPSASVASGDCVDCKMCVTTCPTGIDIRNGLQMECINCTQCIDACDSVMAKLGRPRGLVRYSSQAALEHKTFSLLRARTVLYPVVLAIAFSLFVFVLVTRPPAYISAVRGLGAPFGTLASGQISNPLNIRIINRREHPTRYTITPDDARVTLIAEKNGMTVAPLAQARMPATLAVDPAVFTNGTFDTTLTVRDDHGYARTLKFRIQGPSHQHHVHGAHTSEEPRP